MLARYILDARPQLPSIFEQTRINSNSFILHQSKARLTMTMRSYSHSLSGLERPLPPENEFLYRSRPLPPPPTPPLQGSRLRSRSQQSFTSAPRQLQTRKSSDHLPRHKPVPLVIPTSRQHLDRMSLPSPSMAGRRSSQKVNQLTGYDLGSVDYLPLRRILSSSTSPTDTSSSYSRSIDSPILEEDLISETRRYDESGAPPPLEDDCDGTSSKRSSGAPRSPQPVQYNVSSNRKSTLSHYSSAPESSSDSASDLHVPLPHDMNWRASKSYTYFSDFETADEYHRIANDLAIPERDVYNASSLSTPTQSSFANRLSLSAKSLFKRHPHSSLNSSKTSLTHGHGHEKTYPAVMSIASESDPASPPHSVFETEDEYDEAGDHHMREAIKDFFVRRSEDRSSTEAMIQRPLPEGPEPSSILLKTSGQMKDFFAHGAKKVHTSRAEKRRNQLRSQIRVIPEGIVADNMF